MPLSAHQQDDDEHSSDSVEQHTQTTSGFPVEHQQTLIKNPADKIRLPCVLITLGIMILVIVIISIASVAAKENKTISHHADSGVKFDKPTVLMISLDGFRHDYFEIARTPNMNKLKESGLYAKKTLPVFPSKTFPNHYTMVTGLHAESHGIVSNHFFDPTLQQSFKIGASNGWWGGEPIWVTSKKQGLPSAAYFWPGSEALINDMLPTFVSHFDESKSWDDRVEVFMSWFNNTTEQPRVSVVYFEEPDASGHSYGASSSQVIEKIEKLDALIGNMIEQIYQIQGAKEHFHFILTTDHGMANVTEFIFIDKFINVNSTEFFIQEYYPLLQIWPTDLLTENPILDELYANLSSASPNMTCFLRRNIPDRFHYTSSHRIAPLVCLVEVGFEARTMSHSDNLIGNHGYDNVLEDMAGFFIGTGPRFRAPTSIEVLPDVDVYNIICGILDLVPAPNNGSNAFEIYLN